MVKSIQKDQNEQQTSQNSQKQKSHSEISQKYEKLKQKYKALRKEYTNILEQWENGAKSIKSLLDERKFLRNKLACLFQSQNFIDEEIFSQSQQKGGAQASKSKQVMDLTSAQGENQQQKQQPKQEPQSTVKQEEIKSQSDVKMIGISQNIKPLVNGITTPSQQQAQIIQQKIIQSQQNLNNGIMKNQSYVQQIQELNKQQFQNMGQNINNGMIGNAQGISQINPQIIGQSNNLIRNNPVNGINTNSYSSRI